MLATAQTTAQLPPPDGGHLEEATDAPWWVLWCNPSGAQCPGSSAVLLDKMQSGHGF